MRFDLIDLRLFLNTVEAESITRGAARSHLATASASARIKKMEDTLGTALLERRYRGVLPTPAGRALIHHAQAILHQIELMTDELGHYAYGLRARVRLLSNTAAFTEHLPDLLGDFLLEHPQIDLDVEARPSHVIVDALVNQYAELGVLADSAGLDSLDSRPFRVDRLVLIVRQGHPDFLCREEVGFEELLDHSFVGLSVDSPLQQHLMGKALKLGRHMSMRTRVASFESLCNLVARGVGLAIVPEAVLERCGAQSALSVLKLENTWSIRSLNLCAYRFDALSPHAHKLANYLMSVSEPNGGASSTSAPPA